MRIGFATCRSQPGITPDDRAAARVVAHRGHRVEAVPWDGSGIDWASYAVVVLRSTWNYHLDPGGFEAWLDHLEVRGVAVVNPLPVLRWNLRKSYLSALEAAGLPVIATRAAGPGRPFDFTAWDRDIGPGPVVVKPLVGASAHGVVRLELPRERARLEERASREEVLVQRYRPEVSRTGEWSLIFLDGEYSHAVLKRPAPGDFRVQEELGGESRPGQPPEAIRALGAEALKRTPAPAAYARLDAVETGSGPLLMELELIEPALYLRSGPGAPERFADAVLGPGDRIRPGPGGP